MKSVIRLIGLYSYFTLKHLTEQNVFMDSSGQTLEKCDEV